MEKMEASLMQGMVFILMKGVEGSLMERMVSILIDGMEAILDRMEAHLVEGVMVGMMWVMVRLMGVMAPLVDAVLVPLV